MNSIDQIAAAVGRLPSGLFIITLADAGQSTGYLGSLVQQLSLEPVLIGAAVAPDRPAYKLFQSASHFAIHVIETGQNSMLKHFGRGFGPGEDAFTGLHLDRSQFGVPLIKEFKTRLVLEKKQILNPGGDHALVIGEVVHAEIPEPASALEPWVHLRKNGRGY